MLLLNHSVVYFDSHMRAHSQHAQPPILWHQIWINLPPDIVPNSCHLFLTGKKFSKIALFKKKIFILNSWLTVLPLCTFSSLCFSPLDFMNVYYQIRSSQLDRSIKGLKEHFCKNSTFSGILYSPAVQTKRKDTPTKKAPKRPGELPPLLLLLLLLQPVMVWRNRKRDAHRTVAPHPVGHDSLPTSSAAPTNPFSSSPLIIPILPWQSTSQVNRMWGVPHECCCRMTGRIVAFLQEARVCCSSAWIWASSFTVDRKWHAGACLFLK